MFLNFEGVGVGGWVNFFWIMDREVMVVYVGILDFFGMVIVFDVFGFGFIRSGIDYLVFYDVYG